MKSVLLASESQLKLEAIRDDITRYFKSEVRFVLRSVQCGNPAQPVNSAMPCAENRLKAVTEAEDYDMIVAVENGLLCDWGRPVVDICAVVVRTKDGRTARATSFPVPVPINYYQRIAKYGAGPLGLSRTIGEEIHLDHEDIPKDNWMADGRFGGVDRRRQIRSALEKCLTQLQ